MAQEARLETQGESFEFQLVCINRNVAACELVNSFFIPEIESRTGGQLQFTLSSFPELGIAGGDTLRLIGDNTLEVAEVYSGYVGGDLPLLDVGNLWGLSPSEEAHLELTDAIHEDLVAVLKETTGGQPIMRQYYPNQFIFSREELDSLDQFDNKKIRQHSTILGDLLAGLGAEGQFVAFADVYTALERGVLDAAVSCGTCGSGVRWYEVTDCMVGPIVAIGVTWITMNKEVWDAIPADLQAIIREEGERHQSTSREWVETVWAQEGIDENTEGGMEYIEFSQEIQDALFQAGRNNVLPRWVERTGGPNSQAVQIYNEKAAPIIGVRVGADGLAEDIN